MDIFAHGLWTNAVYEAAAKEKRSRRQIWTAIFFGVASDLIAFGPLFIMSILERSPLWPYVEARFQSEYLGRRALALAQRFHFFSGPPDPAAIPNYVYTLYNFTHSLIIFAAVFLAVWLARKKPYWLMGGWGLHIGIDIWSHNSRFFPTPFLFPVSDYHFSGVSWVDQFFVAVNYSAILAVYLWLYAFRRPKKGKNFKP